MLLRKAGGLRGWGRRLGRVVFRLAAFLLVLAAGYLAYVYATLPDSAHLARENPTSTNFMRQRARELGLPPDTYRCTCTPLAQISPLLAAAVVEAEDSRFREHGGVNWKTTRKAARRYAAGQTAGGGSTISQQLARNLFFDASRTVDRKLREILLALRMDGELSKDRLLELYLNVAEWGDGVWGITAAAQHYFQKSPRELDAFESAFLGSLLPAPRAPVEGDNRGRVILVQRRLLSALVTAQLVGPDAWSEARRRQCALEIELLSGRALPEALDRVGHLTFAPAVPGLPVAAAP
jgi:monofunctional biosynthetic peptidoglycan transglycosylase